MSASKESVNVSRSYEPVPEDCVKALALLLRVPVHNKATRPAPEPDGCNDAAIVRNMEGGESCRAAPR